MTHHLKQCMLCGLSITFLIITITACKEPWQTVPDTPAVLAPTAQLSMPTPTLALELPNATPTSITTPTTANETENASNGGPIHFDIPAGTCLQAWIIPHGDSFDSKSPIVFCGAPDGTGFSIGAWSSPSGYYDLRVQCYASDTHYCRGPSLEDAQTAELLNVYIDEKGLEWRPW